MSIMVAMGKGATGGVLLENAEAIDSTTGRGVVGRVEAHDVALGNRALFDELRIDPGALSAKAEELRRDGQAVMFRAGARGGGRGGAVEAHTPGRGPGGGGSPPGRGVSAGALAGPLPAPPPPPA